MVVISSGRVMGLCLHAGTRGKYIVVDRSKGTLALGQISSAVFPRELSKSDMFMVCRGWRSKCERGAV